jgi:hypothetical protein
MSRTGNWVLEMQEAAGYLTLEAFTHRYGYATAEVWYGVNFGDDRDCEPVFEQEQMEMEMDDGA